MHHVSVCVNGEVSKQEHGFKLSVVVLYISVCQVRENNISFLWCSICALQELEHESSPLTFTDMKEPALTLLNGSGSVNVEDCLCLVRSHTSSSESRNTGEPAVDDKQQEHSGERERGSQHLFRSVWEESQVLLYFWTAP